MSNTLQTNTFTGGLNLDADITMVPNNQYRYAENVRVITDTDGSTGVLQNIQDVKLVEGGDFLFYDEKILATTTIDKYGIIITVDDAHVNRIHRVDNYDNPPLKHTIVVKVSWVILQILTLRQQLITNQKELLNYTQLVQSRS